MSFKLDHKVNITKGLPLMKTYKFGEEKKIRLLPYLHKDGSFKKSFTILSLYQLDKKITEDLNISIPKGIHDTFFYIDDPILTDSINSINPFNKNKYLKHFKFIFFYALIDKKVELVKFRFNRFENIYLKLSKLIHEDKDPFDPMNGIGIRVVKSDFTDLEMTEVDRIVYGNNFRDLLQDRECDLSDIEKYEISKHPNSSVIYTALKEYDQLKEVKWKMRQCRLEKILKK
jgi:hypothetical protein